MFITIIDEKSRRRNGVNGKTFPPIPFSRATATVAVERNYGNGTAERQRQNGNGMVETRHYAPDTRWRNLYQKLVEKTCVSFLRKILTKVRVLTFAG